MTFTVFRDSDFKVGVIKSPIGWFRFFAASQMWDTGLDGFRDVMFKIQMLLNNNTKIVSRRCDSGPTQEYQMQRCRKYR